MKRGHLADFFSGVGVKKLSGTELDPRVSNGHEFQGTKVLQSFLGLPSSPHRLPCTYMWLTDDEAPVRHDGTATWYDSRANQPHRNPEPRLLYTAESEAVVRAAAEGDSLFVCLRKDGRLLILLSRSGSNIEQQLLWLFGLTPPTARLIQNDLRESPGLQLDFAARQVLEAIEIDVPIAHDQWLEPIFREFGPRFPGTAAFSAFARRQLQEMSPLTEPDSTLMAWIELEDVMFHTLERHLIEERLRTGFQADGKIDVEGFVSFSLSVHGRRKSRAGFSLEHHLASLFEVHDLKFDRNGRTEGNKQPDFLFPGAIEYHNPMFEPKALTLLGVKTTCKDRWRQVLSEGRRVGQKHLLTLEPGISSNQTSEMRAAELQLVVPEAIQPSYGPDQQDWLFSVGELIAVIKERAASAKS